MLTQQKQKLVLDIVLHYLDPLSLLRIVRLNKRYQNLALNDNLWKKFLIPKDKIKPEGKPLWQVYRDNPDKRNRQWMAYDERGVTICFENFLQQKITLSEKHPSSTNTVFDKGMTDANTTVRTYFKTHQRTIKRLLLKQYLTFSQLEYLYHELVYYVKLLMPEDLKQKFNYWLIHYGYYEFCLDDTLSVLCLLLPENQFEREVATLSASYRHNWDYPLQTNYNDLTQKNGFSFYYFLYYMARASHGSSTPKYIREKMLEYNAYHQRPDTYKCAVAVSMAYDFFDEKVLGADQLIQFAWDYGGDYIFNLVDSIKSMAPLINRSIITVKSIFGYLQRQESEILKRVKYFSSAEDAKQRVFNEAFESLKKFASFLSAEKVQQWIVNEKLDTLAIDKFEDPSVFKALIKFFMKNREIIVGIDGQVKDVFNLCYLESSRTWSRVVAKHTLNDFIKLFDSIKQNKDLFDERVLLNMDVLKLAKRDVMRAINYISTIEKTIIHIRSKVIDVKELKRFYRDAHHFYWDGLFIDSIMLFAHLKNKQLITLSMIVDRAICDMDQAKKITQFIVDHENFLTNETLTAHELIPLIDAYGEFGFELFLVLKYFKTEAPCQQTLKQYVEEHKFSAQAKKLLTLALNYKPFQNKNTITIQSLAQLAKVDSSIVGTFSWLGGLLASPSAFFTVRKNILPNSHGDFKKDEWQTNMIDDQNPKAIIHYFPQIRSVNSP